MKKVTRAKKTKTQITHPVASSYSFKSRYPSKEEARAAAKRLNGSKHAYYTKVQKNGEIFWDVRVQN